MAPRVAKTKKTTELKVAEKDVPKKSRSKTKPEGEIDIDIDEKEDAIVEKKVKRSKKVVPKANGEEFTEEETPKLSKVDKKPKRAKKVIEDIPIEINNSNDEESPPSEELEVRNVKKNKRGKKVNNLNSNSESKVDTKSTSKRGRKKKTDDVNDEEQGNGDSQAEEETNSDTKETDQNVDQISNEIVKKGRKKAAKPVKEVSPELDAIDIDIEKVEVNGKEPVKKGSKTKKTNAKKKEVDDKEDEEVAEPAMKRRKATKKENGKGDTNEDKIEVEVEDAKVTKGKKKGNVDLPDKGDANTKRKRKPVEDKAPDVEPKKKAPLKNKSLTTYEDIDFTNHSQSPQGKEWNYKISSWNVDGVRAWMQKGGLDFVKYEKPDIFCLQETKCSKSKLPDEVANLSGYHAYWLGSDKDGYAGVGIYTTKLAIHVQYGLGDEDLDSEGRIITAEYEQFYLINTYVPNAGRKLVTMPKRLKWNETFQKHVNELDKKKPVIICGDMNVSHNEIDLSNPKTNRKNAGFTDEEREGMTLLLSDGYVDTYRHLYPNKTGAYTFWTYMMNCRAKNVGWRLDYFIMSERLLPTLCDNVIRSEVFGSDHCPLTLFLNLSTASKPKERNSLM